MSRRYTDRYEERDYYERPSRRRDYEEVDIEVDRERFERRPSRAAVLEERYRSSRQPDFLREDYGRDAAGPLVVRETEKVKEIQRDRGRTDMSAAGSRRGESVERVTKEEVVIKDRVRDDDILEERRPRRARDREEIIVDDRRLEARDRPRDRGYRDVEDEEVFIRRGERDYSPPGRRKEIILDDRDLYIYRGGSRPPPRREFEREEVRIREEISPPRDEVVKEVEKEEVVIRERDPSPRKYDRDIERERIVIDERRRERSRPPPRFESLGPPIAREREEFIFRRRRSPTPPPQDYEREQIVIRRRESSPPLRELTPELIPEPEIEPIIAPRDLSPEALPLYRPPIIQHIYTHHHHIDHGMLGSSFTCDQTDSVRGLARARSPSPIPIIPEPPKKVEETLEVEIRRRYVK